METGTGGQMQGDKYRQTNTGRQIQGDRYMETGIVKTGSGRQKH